MDNPTYCPTTPTVPPVLYSSLGPRDTPTTGHTPPQGQGEGDYQEIQQGQWGERVYQVLEPPSEGEGVYHMLGEAVEGKGDEGRDESAGRAVEMAYSSLQHN